MILPIYLYGSQVLRAKAQDADLEKKEEIQDKATEELVEYKEGFFSRIIKKIKNFFCKQN